MKLQILFVLGIFLQTYAGTSVAQTKRLNLELKNNTLKEVLQFIEQKSEYSVIYKDEYFKNSGTINQEFTNKLATEILDEILEKENLSYIVKGRVIIIMPENESNSQQGTVNVSGKVTDSQGQPMPGVAIMIKGTSKGTITSVSGEYSLSDTPGNATLVFSFVGMKTKEVEVSGNKNIDVTLVEDNREVEEVVVTALGISREKKALGYAVQNVEGEKVTKSKELNVINALAGKISGVHITQGGGNVGGGGARIVIRGETSLAGNNAPLSLVDGIPTDINNVAPEDIESISVLKGPAAAALYGSRAGSGVILITTKKGPKNGRLNVEVNSSVGIQNPMILPEVQDQYGQGTGGVYINSRSISWGPKFENQKINQLWGSDEWKSHPNNLRDFYNTGSIVSNNVSLAGDNKTGRFRVSYTDVRQKGMIPETKYSENRIDLMSGWTFMDGAVDLNTNVKYARKITDNSRSIDSRLWPINLNLNSLKNYWLVENEKQRQWLQYSDNPYFLLHENQNWSQNDNYFGNVTLNMKFTKELSLLLRSGVSAYYNESRYHEQVATEGTNKQYGSFSTGMAKGYEMNSDFLLTYNKNISSEFSLVASVGGNMMTTEGSYVGGNSSQLLVPNVYNLANYRVYPTVYNGYGVHSKNNALYAFVNLGYKGMVFLDITGRNDWTSTLKYKANDSYFYPSASLSFLLNKMLKMNDKIDMLKVKANYAGVGKSIGAFQLDPFYNFTTGNAGIAGIVEGTIKNNSNLKPEYSYSFETGVEASFFKNRLSFDITYYNVRTVNQIWNMNVSPISGYEKIIRNIGEVTSNGLELTINANPVKIGDFQWNSSINWSMDRTEVTKLDSENPEYAVTKELDYRIYTYDFVGERRGAIYSRTARRFQFDPAKHDASLMASDGMLFYDAKKDLPRSDYKVIGYYNPDWIGSWYNEFRYRNITVSALLFANVGNSVFNAFERDMVGKGLDKRTLEGREKGILPNGVWESPEGIRSFKAGDEVNAESYWGDFMVDGELHDIWVEDGSFLKLKEVNIGYDLPKNLLGKSFIRGARLSVTGRNLAVWTKVKYVDPEVFVGGNNGAGLIPGVAREGGVPSTRSFTMNLNIQF